MVLRALETKNNVCVADSAREFGDHIYWNNHNVREVSLLLLSDVNVKVTEI